jgi:hypothetical protein
MAKGDLAALFGQPAAALSPELEQAMGHAEQNIAGLIARSGQGPSLPDLSRSLLMSAAYRGKIPYTQILQDQQRQEYETAGAQVSMLSSLAQMRLRQAEAKAGSNPMAAFLKSQADAILKEGPDGPDRINNIFRDIENDQRPLSLETWGETVAKYPAAAANEAPTTQGGLQWIGPGPDDWAPIPGYLEMREAEAAMTRSYEGPKQAHPQAYRMPDGSIKSVLDIDIQGQREAIAQGGIAISEGDVETSTQKERRQHILMSGDPSSTEYAMAYHEEYEKPRFVPLPNGGVDVFYPPVPTGVRRPTGAEAPANAEGQLDGQTIVHPNGMTQQRIRDPIKQPLPQDAQDNLKLAQSAARQIQVFESNLSRSGPLEGRLRGAANVFGWGGIEDWEAARNNIKLAAQAIIKGIPSDFDVRTLETTLPDINLPENRNQARIQELKLQFQGLIRDAISYYQGKNYDIPPHIYDMAKQFGVNVGGGGSGPGTLYYNPQTGKIE